MPASLTPGVLSLPRPGSGIWKPPECREASLQPPHRAGPRALPRRRLGLMISKGKRLFVTLGILRNYNEGKSVLIHYMSGTVLSTEQALLAFFFNGLVRLVLLMLPFYI